MSNDPKLREALDACVCIYECLRTLGFHPDDIGLFYDQGTVGGLGMGLRAQGRGAVIRATTESPWPREEVEKLWTEVALEHNTSPNGRWLPEQREWIMTHGPDITAVLLATGFTLPCTKPGFNPDARFPAAQA